MDRHKYKMYVMSGERGKGKVYDHCFGLFLEKKKKTLKKISMSRLYTSLGNHMCENTKNLQNISFEFFFKHTHDFISLYNQYTALFFLHNKFHIKYFNRLDNTMVANP